MDVADLRAKIGLDSKDFDSGINNVLGKLNPIGSKALSTSLIATGAVAAIGYAAFKMGQEFDDAYDSIRIGTGATGARLDGLKNDFKKVVTDVPASFGDASAAITGLNQRLDVTGPQLRDLSDLFLELSRITGTNVADNVRLGTRLFGDWSIKTKDQSATMDQLFRATQKSGIGLSDLMATVVQFGAPLRNMGFSFSDSIAMLAKWEKEGVNTSTVLTGMKFALKTFAAAGKEPQAALAEITAKIHDTTNAQAAMTLGMKTFGLRAGPDMVAAIREGRFQYQDFARTIANGSDTIHTAAKDTEDFAESWTKLANTLKVKVEPVVSSVFNAVSAAIKDPFGAQAQGDVRGMMSAIGTLTDKLPKQWGVAAMRTKAIIEDLNRLIEKPEVLGDIHAEHTRGQLKNIRDDIAKQLGISVQEANAIMAMMFKDWNPKETLDAKINPAAAGTEARIAKMRATLARNLAFGKLDNGPLVAKIAAAQAKLDALRAKIKAQIAAGQIDTDNWTNSIAKAQKAFNVWKISVGGKITVGNLIAPPMPTGDYSGGAADVGGAGYGWASALASNFGLSVSSTYRPGAITASGNVSDHGTFGRAADIAGPDSAMNRLWAYIKSTAGSWKQAIHEHQILNYGSLGSYGPSDHFDHVHLARMALGGAINGPAAGYPIIAHNRETIVAHNNPTRGLADLERSGILGGGGTSFTFGSVSVILPPGDYGDSEDAGSAAADAFMQRTRELARGY